MIIDAEKIIYVPTVLYYYKWYENTQGACVRYGNFTEEIYRNFREVWSAERESLQAFCFTHDDLICQDVSRLNHICGLFEGAYNSKKISRKGLVEITDIIASDSFFDVLSRDEVLGRARKHIVKTVRLIKSTRTGALSMYWAVCNFIRRVKYGKQK